MANVTIKKILHYFISIFIAFWRDKMELENYRNFLAIIEAGSLTGAAECVHLAQPALSKQLKALENYFGAKLILTQRGSRQIILTEAGRILYQKAKYICSLDDLAKMEISSVTGGSVGTLRISAANSRSAVFISNVLKDFSRQYPKITYEIYEGGITDQAQQLLNGITELGIFSVPIRHEDSFQVLFRRREELYAVFHQDSPLLDSSTAEITLPELADIPLSISAGCWELLKKRCAELPLLTKIICISTTRSTALQWALDNSAAVIVPAEPEEWLGHGLIKKKINATGIELFKTVVKVKDRPLSVIARKFLQFYAQTRNSQQVCDLDELLRRERI